MTTSEANVARATLECRIAMSLARDPDGGMSVVQALLYLVVEGWFDGE